MVMAMDINGHLDEVEIEKYSFRETAEPELSRVEEHLLVCGSCRDQVAASDLYLHSMRQAAAQKRQEPARGWRWARPSRLTALVLSAAALLLAGMFLIRSKGPTPFAVSLAATRGAGIEAHAPAGVPLALQLDVTGLPAADSYRVEMVDRTGKLVWAGTFPGANTKSEPAGIYFIRLYSAAGDLLREYGLEVAAR